MRSETSLIQTIGRAARNIDGRVLLYADKMTGSMERALGETERRRKKQQDYNLAHNITPVSVTKNIEDILENIADGESHEAGPYQVRDGAMARHGWKRLRNRWQAIICATYYGSGKRNASGGGRFRI